MGSMNEDYTPTTNQVRDLYYLGLLDLGSDIDIPAALAQFDRWLAEHDDGLKAELAKIKADLDEWETVGAPAWVETKNREILEARAEAWDEGFRYRSEWNLPQDNPYRGTA